MMAFDQKKIMILAFCLLFPVSALFSQPSYRKKIDSLLKVLPRVPDTSKFDVYKELVYYYQNFNPDSTLYCINKGLEWAKKTGNIGDQAKAWYDLGKVAYFKSDYQKATGMYLKSVELYKKAGNYKQEAAVYHDLGNLYWTQTNFLKASEYFLIEQEICEKNNDSFGIARSLIGISFIYGKSAEYDEELRLYKKALDIWKKLGHKPGISVTLVNIGNVYKFQQNNQEALKYYRKALYYRQFDNIRFSDVLLFNMGEVFLDLGKYDSSERYFRKSLAISDRFQNNYTSAYNHLGLAHLYLEKKIQDSVYFHLQKALQNAVISNTPDCLMQIYKSFAEYYSMKKDYANAYKYQEKYIHLNDSLSPSEARQKIAAYEFEKVRSKLRILQKESEIASLKTERSRNQRNYLAILMVMVLLLGGILHNRYLYRKKTNALLELKNAELEKTNYTKDKFFAIIAHDLKNHLTAFQNVTQNLSENYEGLNDVRRHHLVTRLWHSSQSLYGMLENLLTWSMSQLKRIEFNPEKADLSELSGKVQAEMQLTAAKKQIRLENGIPHGIVAEFDINMICTVLRNLLANAIKFSPENSVIRVGLERKDDEIVVCVADNGIGMSSVDLDKLFRMNIDHKSIGHSTEKGTGLGLILCREFILRHNGKIWAESRVNEGSTFYFSIPLNNNNKQDDKAPDSR